MTPGQGGVIARAASDEIHPIDATHGLGVEAELGIHQVALLEQDATAQRIFDCSRLLEDLLQHEVLVAALLGLDRAPIDVSRSALDAFSAERLHARAVAR